MLDHPISAIRAIAARRNGSSGKKKKEIRRMGASSEEVLGSGSVYFRLSTLCMYK